MKSLLSGAFWGIFTGGTALTLVSLAAPQPAGNTPPSPPQVDAPETVAETPTPIETPTEIANVSEPTTEVEAPGGLAPVTQSPLPEADTTPLGTPETVELDTALASPDASTTPTVAAGDEEPVLPNPQSVAPQIPIGEDDLIVSTQPAEPTPDDAPVLVEDDPAAALDSEDVVVTEVVPDPEEAPSVEDTAPALTASDTDILATPEVGAQTPASENDAPETAEAPALEQPESPTAAPVIVGAETAESEAADAEPDAPVVVSIIEENSASTLPSGSGGVVVNRSIGSSAAAEEESGAAEPDPVDPDAPAIERYAADFDNVDEKPTMSLVVLDDGSLDGAVEALQNVPFPVTVALDPTAPNAAETMAAYRAAGIEVAVIAKLPAGARPTDVEIAMEAAFAALPETVAMIDSGDGNLQGDRAVLSQAMAALSEDGRGLITVSQGLNTGLQAAADNGVPAGLIFRDLDGNGQDERVIRRFMEQAAFRARQESGVVLLARLRPETLNALIAWGNANRAGQVAMAPVSVVLTNDGS